MQLAELEQQRAADSEMEAPLSHIKVLLIEDNPADARLFQIMLADVEADFFEVVCADRVADGLERVVDRLVVFIDAGHRGERGIAVIRRRVELEVSDVGDECELGSVERREYTLIFDFLHLGVGHVADQREIERPLLCG